MDRYNLSTLIFFPADNSGTWILIWVVSRIPVYNPIIVRQLLLLYGKLRLLSHRVHLGPEGPCSGDLLLAALA